ncbi:GYD domain-containing protein [Streptomyces sp. KR80]|uniref:GYD domain-containing protein n=1 Tax=Streptomyces sp. KR80 TaxID=3457426 RepID=UPI003FD103F3
MAKYLFRAKLTVDGLNGLLKEGGTARREVVERLVQSLGGRLESIHWAFGDEDVYVVADLPDNPSAAAMGMVVSAAGGVRTSTVVLLTAEEMDEAVQQRAKRVEYRKPGG